MRSPRALMTLLVLAALACLGGPADAFDAGKYRFEFDADIHDVRAHDVDGDGRDDLVVIAERVDGIDRAWVVFVLISPKSPTPGSYFGKPDVTEIPMRGEPAAALALGRFGPDGETTLRFFDEHGVVDRDRFGEILSKRAIPTLLSRTGAQPVVFWDAVADLDGDGLDEVWFPGGDGDGAIRVLTGDRKSDHVLTLEPNNQGGSTAQHDIVRSAYIPQLVPADLDGDGKRELVALKDTELLGWSLPRAPTTEPVAPGYRLALPFLEPDPSLAAEAMRVPRVQLEDVDGDGTTDLLVTLISGRRDRLGSLRTTLFHYPGPFRDKATGKLIPHRARIDTESVALHPVFVDLDGDGALDYVGDSIRGTRMDLLARIMGKDPEIHYVGFRFDPAAGTFASTPHFTQKRLYPSSEAVSNAFRRVAWFGGDFDGDETSDLLDVGDLSGVTILRGVPKTGSGPGDPLGFGETLMPTIEVEEGVGPGGLITDLSGDGRDDAVLWGKRALYLVVPRGAK